MRDLDKERALLEKVGPAATGSRGEALASTVGGQAVLAGADATPLPAKGHSGPVGGNLGPAATSPPPTMPLPSFCASARRLQLVAPPSRRAW